MKESTFQSWDEVNENMKKLAELKVKKQKLEGEQTLAINEIKAKCNAKAVLISDEIKAIEKNMALFAEQNKDEFALKRTKKLMFGTISYRLTKKIVCSSIETAVKALKTLNLDSFLRVKEELDKDALLELDESILTKAGISIKREDKISIEPDSVRINSLTQ